MKTIRVTAWDFAGQPLQLITHRLFLTTGCIYLVVYNARANTIAHNEQHVKFYLDLIRSSHNSKRDSSSPPLVIVVGTRADSNTAATSVNQQTILAHVGDSMRVRFASTGVDLRDKKFIGVEDLMRECVGMAEEYWEDFGKVFCFSFDFRLISFVVSSFLVCLCVSSSQSLNPTRKPSKLSLLNARTISFLVTNQLNSIEMKPCVAFLFLFQTHHRNNTLKHKHSQ
jgi:hypothetical protein